MSEASLVDGLGAFPIIQIAVAGAIAAGAVLAWYRGERSKPDPGGLPPGASWFFDGPIIKALETLQGIYRVLGEMRADNARFAHEHNEKLDQQIDLLRQIRGGQDARRRR